VFFVTIMSKGENPLPKELFSPSFSNEIRVYSYIDLFGNKQTEELRPEDYLSEVKCSIDGANIIIYPSRLGNVPECPCCNQQFSSFSSEELIEDLEQQHLKLETQYNILTRLIYVAKHPNHQIKLANLENKAMLAQSSPKCTLPAQTSEPKTYDGCKGIF